ncbi:MAG: ABC transporter permease [Candidatus Bathyarchaeia archaeon]
MGYRRYVVKRSLEAIPSIVIVLLVSFIIVRVVPGDPAQLIAGEAASPSTVAAIRTALGLDKPLWEQLIIYFQQLSHGDLGFSYTQHTSVAAIILTRLPNTLMLVGSAITLGVIFGVALGCMAASKAYSLRDTALTIWSLASYAAPSFWVAQMLILLLAVEIPIFPAGGFQNLRNESTGGPAVLDVLWHLFLPVLTLLVAYMAEQFRLTRASMLEILGQDYITTARAKGVNRRTVIFSHGLRNALLPVVTLIGLRFGSIFTGAVLTEVVFGWPGVGRLMYESVIIRDYPVVLGCFIFVSSFVIVGAFITDLLYAAIDPRIRYE